jgi:hypothetical protein
VTARTPVALAALVVGLAYAPSGAAAAGTPVPSGITIQGPGLAPVATSTPAPIPTWIGDAISISRPRPVPTTPEQPIRLPRTGEQWTVAGYGVLATVAALLLRRRSGR